MLNADLLPPDFNSRKLVSISKDQVSPPIGLRRNLAVNCGNCLFDALCYVKSRLNEAIIVFVAIIAYLDMINARKKPMPVRPEGEA